MEKKKKKLNIKKVLVLLLIVLSIGLFIFYLWQKPIDRVVVSGNKVLKDNYIINYLNLKDKSVLQINRKKIKSKLMKLDLVSDVKVRKNYLGTLYITIKEDFALFYNWNNKKVVLSSGKEVSYSNEFLGIPTLINYVPDETYDELLKKLNIVKKDILYLVSEIEYSPSIVSEKIVDDKRFLFRMNDGNLVYINTINIDKFNNYLEIYEAVSNKGGEIKGCLYLDSNSENKHFGSCDEKKIESNEDENSES